MSEDSELQNRDQDQHLMRKGLWRQTVPSLVGLLLGVAIVIFFGPSWVTWLLVAILVCAVVIIQQTFGRQTWREGAEDHAGMQECPNCGSLQTDLVERFRADGTEYEQMHCFACDTDIGEKRLPK